MMASVETYLAVRRAVGFTLSNTEYLLRSFADFATDLKETRRSAGIGKNHLAVGGSMRRMFLATLNR